MTDVTPGPISEQIQEARPSAVVIGTNPEAPILTIKPFSSPKEFASLKPVDACSKSTISRLGPLLQAVPSLLVAQQTFGKQLMEVVVNGNLVAAADGNGLRAFVTGPTGIREHARLFNVSNLQNLINVAAIWQVASVLVAQKHLADISSKLDEIKKGLAGISQFLDNQRKARITSTYEYLGQVYTALQRGELSESTRNQLESCERDLLEICNHLVAEYRQKADARVEVSETGTGELYKGIETKLEELDLLAQDISFCLKTRIAAWHVLSLFPGNRQLIVARRESIHRSVLAFFNLGPDVRNKVQAEIDSIDSIWNKGKTLEKRKRSLTERNAITFQNLTDLSDQGLEQIKRSEQVLLEDDRPTHLLLSIEDGVVVSVEEGT